MTAKVPQACQIACSVKLKKEQRDAFTNAITHDYRAHWIVDSLPVGVYEIDRLTRETVFTRGFPIGFSTKDATFDKVGRSKEKFYLYNHVRIVVQYHDDKTNNVNNPQQQQGGEDGAKIVGFRVEPMSIKHAWEGGDIIPGTTVLSTCNAMTPAKNDASNYQTVNTGDVIVFTYDVKWESSERAWANRWDIYLTASPATDKVHWFSITNSIMIVLFLTVMIAMILIRALRKDIAQYNDPSSLEEVSRCLLTYRSIRACEYMSSAA